MSANKTTKDKKLELRAAKFLRKQRRKLRNGTLRPERRTYLDEQMPGWDSVELDRILGI